ncbi:MAG: sigma-54-dependent Fis family transcriptional regulator [Sedimentisphaerales bacterium]|nr:sigma-54-dependent Fis family transcriptional regulator [Sedimentisphaerales bacterium]
MNNPHPIRKTPSQNSSIANVLIVDNDPRLARLMLEILARKGIRGIIAETADAAIHSLEKADYSLVFTSDRLCQRPGDPETELNVLKLLDNIKANSPEMPVIMLADIDKNQAANLRQAADVAVRAIKAGCCEFLLKPPDPNRIETLLDTLLPGHPIRNCDSAEEGLRTLYRIVGKSKKLLQTINLAKKIAPTSIPVLVSGESGTGKELISYLIHHNSKRTGEPYIRVNCAALSDSLLESELFGHEKGAFTGAYAQRKGRFEMAHGGTLLLDEIAETPIKFQAKLLRVLEQQDFERVGGNDNVKVNVRIISTTNKDLLEMVELGEFRRDLYYRLSGVRLILCPLRQRTDDLPELVWHFVNLYARQALRRITALDPSMMDIFAKYNWPGNVRQLRNVVLTSLVLGVGETLSLADVSWLFDELQPRTQEMSSTLAAVPCTNLGLGGIPLVQVEKQAILDTLRQTAGNKTQAAKVLGISDRTLRDKVRRYRRQQEPQPVG